MLPYFLIMIVHWVPKWRWWALYDVGESDHNSDYQQWDFWVVARVWHKHRKSNEVTRPRRLTMVSDEQDPFYSSYNIGKPSSNDLAGSVHWIRECLSTQLEWVSQVHSGTNPQWLVKIKAFTFHIKAFTFSLITVHWLPKVHADKTRQCLFTQRNLPSKVF